MGNVLFPLSFLFGDKRSYLYPGKSKSQLTPEEKQLEALYDKMDTPSNRITPQQFFQTPEASRLLDQIHGSIVDRVPPGSQIVQQTPSKVTYRDADGFEHTVTRKPDGTVSTLTNRPAILPDRRGDEQIASLQARVNQGLQPQTISLANLDPQTAAALQAISQAEVGANDKELADLQGQLLARLYGAGVNRSSVADDAAARFTEGAGRVRQQQRSAAADRELGIRNLLTTLQQQSGQAQTSTAASLLASLTGQGAQRDIAGAGLDVELQRLAEGGRQFDASNEINRLLAQLERDRFDRSNDAISQISRLIGVGQQGAAAASGGLSAYRALTGGR